MWWPTRKPWRAVPWTASPWTSPLVGGGGVRRFPEQATYPPWRVVRRDATPMNVTVCLRASAALRVTFLAPATHVRLVHLCLALRCRAAGLAIRGNRTEGPAGHCGRAVSGPPGEL